MPKSPAVQKGLGVHGDIGTLVLVPERQHGFCGCAYSRLVNGLGECFLYYGVKLYDGLYSKTTAVFAWTYVQNMISTWVKRRFVIANVNREHSQCYECTFNT